jgi:peptidoglycan/xylan/chitin deacetylase (PgdA/CDA1 family)
MMNALVSHMPYGLIKHLPQAGLIVPYYHMISDHPVPHVRHLYAHKGVREFERDLEFLLRHYTPIGLQELLAALRCGRVPPKRSFLLTFDDGFREMSDVVAPLLHAKGVPAVFFVTTAFLDNRALGHQHTASVIADRLPQISSPALIAQIRSALAAAGTRDGDLAAALASVPYRQRSVLESIARMAGIDTRGYLQQERPYLTSEQVLGLIKQGFAIGAHSIDHPLYEDLTLEEQLRQTRESVRHVRETYHLDYGAFAFPHHDRGVSLRFFAELYGTGALDVSFGTGGLIRDDWPMNIQRLSFERPRIPAQEVIVYAAARRIYRTIVGRDRQLRR